MVSKFSLVCFAVVICSVNAVHPPPPCPGELEPLPPPCCGHPAPADLTPAELSPCESPPPPTIRRLRTITIPGRRNHIIEHHSRPIWIKSAVTRFVVPSSPVIVKPVLIHHPSSISVKPNVVSKPGPSIQAPVLLRIVKQIEQPSTQRTLILERPTASSSCRIEAMACGAGAGLGGPGLGGPGCGHSTCSLCK